LARAGQHLPGLDGLRGLAALGVTIHHFEQVRFVYGFPNFWQVTAINRLGGVCVSLFFVLSGFLITLLLLWERNRTGRISVGNFYMRRILRVWPLYFVITFLGFFILPFLQIMHVPTFAPVVDPNYWKKFGLYLVFAPHIEAYFYPSVQYAGVLWSVGVEEWFYLGWPWLLIWARRRLWQILVGVIIFFLVGRSVLHSSTAHYLLSQVRFDCMAVGAFGALAYVVRPPALVAIATRMSTRSAQIAMIVLMLAAALFLQYVVRVEPLEETIFSVFFVLLILNLSLNPAPILRLDHPALRWLGKVSYSLYCFNWVALVGALLILRPMGIDLSGLPGHLFHFGVAMALSVGVAGMSYFCIERPFLNLKTRSFSSSDRLIAPLERPSEAVRSKYPREGQAEA
jgi:peptidoglycan/LPS O-acetylase OafA/YrhL